MNSKNLSYSLLIPSKVDKMKLLKTIRYYLMCNYICLYYYQILIDKFNIHYDRNGTNQIDYKLRHYQLKEYRKQYRKSFHKSLDTNPWFVQIPNHLIYLKYYFAFLLVRNFAIIFIKPTTSTVERRIWIGTAFLEKDSVTIEMTILIWSFICFLFLQFTLTNTLTDYKFLSLNRITEYGDKYHRPSNFGLDSLRFKRFKMFRKFAWLLFHIFMTIIPIFVMMISITLAIYRGYYKKSPMKTIFSITNYVVCGYFLCNGMIK